METKINRSMRLTVVGIGYVGVTTGVALAYHNHHITRVYKDLEKRSMIREECVLSER